MTGRDQGASQRLETLADPHCHTTASDGLVSPAELVAAAMELGLGLIAITDHDTMANAREVKERGEEAGLAVVMGQELTTRWPALTHVLGLFLETPIRSGLSVAGTVDAIHDQDGLAVIPHPFMPVYFASCQPWMLARLIEDRRVDGIEIMHTAPMTRAGQQALEGFYEANRDRLGARLGSSDSHLGRHDLGRVVTAFPGRGEDAFRAAVVAGATEPRRSPARSRPPLAVIARQQVSGLIGLPLKRLRGQL